MEVTNGVVLGAGSTSATDVNLRNEGRLDICENASFYSHNHVYFGNTQCSTGIVAVAGHGSFHGAASFYMGVASNAVGRLAAQDDAAVVCGGVLYLGNAKQAKAYVALKDRATLSVSPVIGNWMCLAPNTDDAYGRFEATDDAVVTLGNGSSVEMTMGGTSRAELVLSGNARLLGGSGSFVTNKSTVAGNTVVSLSSNASPISFFPPIKSHFKCAWENFGSFRSESKISPFLFSIIPKTTTIDFFCIFIFFHKYFCL
jgi:hypothetical protein